MFPAFPAFPGFPSFPVFPWSPRRRRPAGRARLASIALLFAALAFGLPGCGDGSGPPLRIRIESFAVDGPAPTEGLVAVRRGDPALEEADARYDLVRSAQDGSEYEVAGGRDGHYEVVASAGWFMLPTGAGLAVVRAGAMPTPVRLARAHSVYLGPVSPQVRAGARWGAVRLEGAAGRRAVPVEILVEPPGYVRVLRVAPGDWTGEIEVCGDLALGDPVAGSDDAPGELLAVPLRFTAASDGRPYAVRLEAAATVPVRVVAVPAGAAGVPDAAPSPAPRVRLEVEGLPFPYGLEAEAVDGVAPFPRVPVVGRPFSLALTSEPGARFPLLAEEARWSAEVRILVGSGAGPRRAVTVELGDPGAVDRVQVRAGGGSSFGRVAPRVEPGAVVFSAPPGPFEVLLHAGPRSVLLSGDGDGPLRLRSPDPFPGARVEGQVREAVPGTVVRFRLRRTDGAVDGDGFALRLAPQGTFEGLLPLGTWEVVLEGPWGRGVQGAPLVLERPGARVHLPLRVPAR